MTQSGGEREALIAELRTRGGDFDVPYERSYLRKLLDKAADMLAADAPRIALTELATNAETMSIASQLLVKRTAERDNLRAELEDANSAQQVAVPQGLLKVLREASEFIGAANYPLADTLDGFAWMLSAAPQPPQAALVPAADLTDAEIEPLVTTALRLHMKNYPASAQNAGVEVAYSVARAVLAAQKGKK